MNKQDAAELLEYIDTLARYIEHESHIEEIKLFSIFNLISLCAVFFLGYFGIGQNSWNVNIWALIFFTFIGYVILVFIISDAIIERKIDGNYKQYIQLLVQLKIDLLTNPETFNKKDILDLLLLVKRKFGITQSIYNQLIRLLENS